MQAKARTYLKDLRWIVEADRHLTRAQAELHRHPEDRQLQSLIWRMQEVIAHERTRFKSIESQVSATRAAV